MPAPSPPLASSALAQPLELGAMDLPDDGVLDLTSIDPDRGAPATSKAGGAASRRTVFANSTPVLVPAEATASLQQRVEELMRENAELRRERDEFAARSVGPPKPDLAVKLAEAGKALVSIRQARDSVLARNHELIQKLAETDDRLAELVDQRELAERERDEALARAGLATQELEPLQQTILTLTAQQSDLAEAELAYVTSLAEHQQQIAALTAERDELRLQGGGAPTLLNPAVVAGQPRLERIFAEYETARTQFEEERAVLEAQIAALREQLLASVHLPGQEGPASVNPEAGETMELRARLAAAEAEQEELRSRLAAVRSLAHDEAPAEAASPLFVFDETEPSPLEEDPVASLREGMAASLRSLGEINDHAEALAEFHAQCDALETEAGLRGNAAAGHLARACADLVKYLRKMPAKVPLALPHLEEAVGLLGLLISLPDSASVPGAEGAVVYAVDGDVDNCECIAMALEKVGLQTKYAVRAGIALDHLAACACGLVIVDADRLEVTGPDFSAQLRQVEGHSATPLLLLGGLPPEGEAFLAKPYQLNHLSLKALTLIYSARLAAI